VRWRRRPGWLPALALPVLVPAGAEPLGWSSIRPSLVLPMAAEGRGGGRSARATALGDATTLGARLADDPAAWRECYAVHGPMVQAYLRRLVPSPDVDDVLQQAFLDVWRSRDRYDPARPLEPWLLGVARKRAIDHLRRLGRSAAVADVDRHEEVPSPDAFADQFADAVTVRAALAGLTSDQREVLVLAYFGGLTQTQIAERLGVPLGTVKARSHRGLRALATALVPEEDPT